jgi:hypothetical protein
MVQGHGLTPRWKAERFVNQRPTADAPTAYADGALCEPETTRVVREIFGALRAGQSCRGIAADLTRRGIPHPGRVMGKRETRRPAGWEWVSNYRTLQRNPRYRRGVISWNVSERVDGSPIPGDASAARAPDMSQWIQRQDESPPNKCRKE